MEAEAHQSADFAVSLPPNALTNFHLSCASDLYRDECEYAGFVLCSYNGRNKWTLNGRRCLSGYIVIQDTASPDVRKQAARSEHGKVFKNVFGEDLSSCVEGQAFAVRKGGRFEWGSPATSDSGSEHSRDEDQRSRVKGYMERIVRDWMEAGRTENGLGCRNYPLED